MNTICPRCNEENNGDLASIDSPILIMVCPKCGWIRVYENGIVRTVTSLELGLMDEMPMLLFELGKILLSQQVALMSNRPS